MGTPDLKTTTQFMLDNTTTTLFTQLDQTRKAQTAFSEQHTQLQVDVANLSSKLANVQKGADTYNREFLDRSGKNTIGAARRFGLSTLQDWLFLLFFVSYGVICLCILIFTVMVSKEKIFAGISVLSVSLILGVIMANVIIRFV